MDNGINERRILEYTNFRKGVGKNDMETHESVGTKMVRAMSKNDERRV